MITQHLILVAPVTVLRDYLQIYLKVLISSLELVYRLKYLLQFLVDCLLAYNHALSISRVSLELVSYIDGILMALEPGDLVDDPSFEPPAACCDG